MLARSRLRNAQSSPHGNRGTGLTKPDDRDQKSLRPPWAFCGASLSSTPGSSTTIWARRGSFLPSSSEIASSPAGGRTSSTFFTGGSAALTGSAAGTITSASSTSVTTDGPVSCFESTTTTGLSDFASTAPLISGFSASIAGASSTTGTFHSKLFRRPVTGDTGDHCSET